MEWKNRLALQEKNFTTEKMFQKKIRKQRIVLVGIVIVLGVMLVTWFNKTNPPVKFESVMVQSGDSVWTISKKSNLVKNETDIRDVVAFVIDINELDQDATIHPGQRIMIPQLQ